MMASGICCKREILCPEKLDLAAAARFYGVRGEDAQALALLQQWAPVIRRAAAPRMVWASFSVGGQQTLLAGEDIAAHLQGCGSFVLLGVTLGTGADAAVRRAGVGDVAAGAAADALASALAEQCCDAAEAFLKEHYADEGLFLTGRFSPGYGDWPLAAQKRIAALLDLPKMLGVTVTQTNLMLPRKSVTAAMGLAHHPVNGKLAGCAHCALQGRCEYRRKGQTCEQNEIVLPK
ncbi:MAG: methionine synthase [Faecalibacterium sp.]|jgi:hypothetical protein|nr:methionine synthase [Faecalibacterium sp.]